MGRRFSEGTALLIGRILVGLCSGVSLIITARYVGSEIFARFGVIMIFLNILMDILDFGSGSMSSRQLASKQITASQFFCRMKVKSLFLFFVITSAIPLFLVLSISKIEIFFLITYSILWIQVNYIQSYLLVVEKYLYSFLLLLLERCLWLSVILFAFFQISKEASFVIPLILGLLCHVLFGYKILKIPHHSRSELLLVFKEFYSSRSYAMGSITTDFATFDSNLVVYATNAASGGSYVLGQRFKNQLIMGYVAFATRIRNSFAMRDRSELVAVLEKEKHLVYLNTLGILFLLPISFNYADNVFGPSYPNINLILTLIFANTILSGLTFILFEILTFAGFVRELASQFLPLIPLQLIVIFFSASKFGVIGATFALLITSFSMFLRLVLLARLSFRNYFD